MVKAAAQGASLFVYLGHGYGFPSPYREVLSPSVQDGIGINGIGGVNDSDLKYYGETSIANEIRFAKNAVVILSGLCYAAGSSEKGDPAPTTYVARQRIDNFASGFIKAGARVVVADTWVGSVIDTIQKLFTTDQTFEDIWTNAPNYHPSELPFIPVRNPQYSARVDAESGFYRSFVGAMDMRTTEFLAGAGAATTLAVPDSVAPELWSVDGPRDLTPNFDGKADRLNLLARYSETRDLDRRAEELGRRRRSDADGDGAPGGDQLGPQGERRPRAGWRLHVESVRDRRRRQSRRGRERAVHDHEPADARHGRPVVRPDHAGIDQVRHDPLCPASSPRR